MWKGSGKNIKSSSFSNLTSLYGYSKTSKSVLYIFRKNKPNYYQKNLYFLIDFPLNSNHIIRKILLAVTHFSSNEIFSFQSERHFCKQKCLIFVPSKFERKSYKISLIEAAVRCNSNISWFQFIYNYLIHSL